MVRHVSPFALLLFLSFSANAQAKRPFTFEDMMALRRISDPVISPKGKWILFSAVDVNLAENQRTNHLWIVPLAGGDAHAITSGSSGEERGRWSPDGEHILFDADRDGGSQLYVADFDEALGRISGERKLTSISTEAGGAIWSPDGRNILFLSSVYPECPDDACNKARDQAKAKSKVKASIFTHLLYRHWSSYTKFKRSHLFIIPAEGGTPRDLTPGDHDVPPFHLGGQDLYAFSPDGQEVAFTSNIDEVEATSTNNEVFLISTTGGQPKKISNSRGSDSTPLYSPDGSYIAYRSQARAGYESDRFRLMLYHRKTGTISEVTKNFDRWVESFAWTRNSNHLYIAAGEQGEQPIYAANINDGQIQRLIAGHNDELSVSPDGRTLVFTRMSIQAPSEIHTGPTAAPSSGSQLTHLNDPVLAQVFTTPLESFWFTGTEKAKVQGFIVKPPDFDAAKKYPVKFLIHGGPQGAWGNAWTYRWNAELLAANGYVVVEINPRGSTGYGQKFIDDVNGDWGGRAYDDLMRGLDYVEKTYSYIDKDRECAMGASYGGYMVNWIITHTDRFKCAVSHDGMFNTESAYGTTEELWFNEWEFKGTPWSNRRVYRKWSPHLHVTKIKTPTLVVHSQQDYRLDVSEGFQLFTTLQRLKVPSKMLYFPDEGHWVLKPQNSQLWYKTVNDWVNSYLKQGNR